MEHYSHIELIRQNQIAVLTFNRPDQLNAMNRRMMDELVDSLERISEDQGIRVAILTGKGRSFMAGADIKEYSNQLPGHFHDFRQKGTRLYELIEGSAIPFIAAVNGFALGGGFEIMLSCDFVIAAASASMGLPEVHLGLIPGGGGTYRLLQKVGMNRVKEAVLLGKSYKSEDMYNWGIVNKVTPEGEVMQEALQWAEKLKRRPADSLRTLKKMLTPALVEQSFNDRLAEEGKWLFELFQTGETQKLIKAFAEKNKTKNAI
jgi:enoyl-CoA hydratase/3-hydroxypropionyl-coenzyme A dehydratase